MARYRFNGFHKISQEAVSGFVEAENIETARMTLMNNDLQIESVQKTSAARAFSTAGIFASRPSTKEYALFIRQLSTMQNAGIPLTQSLGMLSDQMTNKNFALAISRVEKSVEGGTPLNESMKRQPKIFDRLFVQMVAAGEASGALDVILDRLAHYYERINVIKRKITSAMAYPVVVVCIVSLIFLFLMLKVVPDVSSMYKSFGGELPQMTQTLLAVSNFMLKHIVIIFLVIVAIIVGIVYVFKNEDSKKIIDPLMLGIPIFGSLFKKAALSRFARTLATTVRSGVPILDALEITASTAGNYVIETAILDARSSIEAGESISVPMGESGVFPDMVVGMIAVGEQTGELDKMLEKVAEYYENEVEGSVDALTSILEPLLIVFVGALVASILIPMYLPILKMGEIIGGNI